MRVMDRVAYINHDIDDAVRAGVLPSASCRLHRSRCSGTQGSQRIDALVHDMVEHSAGAGEIVQGERAASAMAALREFMFERVYLGEAARTEHSARWSASCGRLFEHYCRAPELS